jgi:hypothetical protein
MCPMRSAIEPRMIRAKAIITTACHRLRYGGQPGLRAIPKFSRHCGRSRVTFAAWKCRPPVSPSWTATWPCVSRSGDCMHGGLRRNLARLRRGVSPRSTSAIPYAWCSTSTCEIRLCSMSFGAYARLRLLRSAQAVAQDRQPRTSMDTIGTRTISHHTVIAPNKPI